MASRVNIILDAVDNVSKTLLKVTQNIRNTTQQIDNLGSKLGKLRLGDSLAASINGLDSKFDRAARSASDLGDEIRSIGSRGGFSPLLNNVKDQLGEVSEQADGFLSNFTANLAMEGIFQLTRAYGALSSSITSAAELQSRMISDAAGLAAVAGISLPEAQAIQSRSIKANTLSAAELPGETKDYNAVGNILAPALVKSFDVKTPEGLAAFEKRLGSITKSTAFLGISQGLQPEDTGQAMSQMMSGVGWGELKLLAFLQKNPAFKSKMQDKMQAAGVSQDDFKDVSPLVKSQWIEEVGKSLLTPESIEAFSGTADAIISTFKSNLLDPMVGTFGMLRKGVGSGNRSVLDAFTGFLKTWMDFGSVAANIGNKLGLSFDPLLPIVMVLDLLSDVANELSLFLNGIKIPKLKAPDMSGYDIGDNTYEYLDKVVGSVFRWISRTFNNIINSLLSFVTDMDISEVTKGIVGFIHFMMDTAVSTLLNIDWFLFGKLLGEGIFKLLGLLVNTLLTLDFSKVFKLLLAAVVGFFKFIAGILVGADKGIGDSVKAIIKSQADSVGRFFSDIFEGIKSLWDVVQGWINKALSIFKNPVKVAKEIGKDFRETAVDPVVRGGKKVVTGVQAAAKSTSERLSGALGLSKPNKQPETPKEPPTTLKALPVTPVAPSTPSTPLATPVAPSTPSTPLATPVAPRSLPEVPKPNNTTQVVSKLFNPVINLTAPAETNLEALANLVTAQITAAYNQYSQERLA